MVGSCRVRRLWLTLEVPSNKVLPNNAPPRVNAIGDGLQLGLSLSETKLKLYPRLAK